MCGIALLFDLRAKDLAIRMENALSRMQHRGPDGKGLYVDDQVVIGHRRLSIVDIEGSRQPMLDPSGRYCLTFNGEIYNYRELRNLLSAHWSFQTNGDTEVLLAGLIVFGQGFLERLEGMWAFALWDRQEQSILLSRDRMGKKPLYYSKQQTGFACASELPTLRTLSHDSWHEDEDSTADYLRYGYFLPGYTAYREVEEVLPGHWIRWDSRTRNLEQHPYWQLVVDPFQGPPKAAVELVRETLVEAVQKRLVADVEVGAFLSGGVDSSLIVGIATQFQDNRLKTFTIGFDNPAFDERKYALRAANHFGTDHHAEQLSHFVHADLENLLLEHVGQPFQDSSLLPTALVSKVAARQVKVVLSGDGGDELFSGYQRYQARAILRWYTRLPRSLRKASQKLLRTLPEPGVHHSRSLLKKAHLFCDVVDRMDEETPYIAPLMFREAERQQLAPDLARRGHQPPGIPTFSEMDDIARMMRADALVYLPQDILTKVDRASMASSIEARAPFLDHKVVELAFSLPSSYHRYGLSGKRMLKAAFNDILPEWIWKRRKQGFAIPVHQWFRQELGSSLSKLLGESINSPLNMNFVESLLAEHKSGTRDHGYRLWLIYAYLIWRKRAI